MSFYNNTITVFNIKQAIELRQGAANEPKAIENHANILRNNLKEKKRFFRLSISSHFVHFFDLQIVLHMLQKIIEQRLQ